MLRPRLPARAAVPASPGRRACRRSGQLHRVRAGRIARLHVCRIGGIRMKPSRLPHVADEPKAAWLNGWLSGLAVGAINGMALAVLLLKVLKV